MIFDLIHLLYGVLSSCPSLACCLGSIHQSIEDTIAFITLSSLWNILAYRRDSVSLKTSVKALMMMSVYFSIAHVWLSHAILHVPAFFAYTGLGFSFARIAVNDNGWCCYIFYLYALARDMSFWHDFV
jgi:hypothetical protein